MKGKKFSYVLFAVVILAMLFSFSTASFAGSVTTSPSFIPNFPMLAGDNVMIMWVPVPNAVKYKIYLNGKPIGEAPAPPFTTPAPQDPGTYKYTLTGVGADGAEGPVSKEGVLSIIKLVQPKDVSHQVLGGIMNLRWTKAPGAVIYDVHRAETKDGPYKLIASVTDDKYVDADVKQEGNEGKSFFYKVISKDQFGGTSSDAEIYEAKIPEKAKAAKGVKNVVLRIRRSKLDLLAKPMGSGSDIKSVGDAKFTNDGSRLIYTDALQHRIAVLDKYGDQESVIGEAGPKPNQYKVPSNLVVDSDGTLYVADSMKHIILAYDSSGGLIYAVKPHVVTEESVTSKIKKYEGKTPPNIAIPRGMAVWKDKLYMNDSVSSLIQMYNKSDGSFIGYYKNKETGELPTFGAAAGLTISSDGKMYIRRTFMRLVNVYDVETGEHLYDLGRSKTFVGAFVGISGIGFDNDGNIMVTDSAMNSVQFFSKEDGSYMYHLGGEKAIPDPRSNDQRPYVAGLEFPGAINMDKQGRVWVYVHGKRCFAVRSFTSEDIWDILKDKPEGKIPEEFLK